MYDMYPWDSTAERPRAGDPASSGGAAPRATAAVQVALDRRDNGGEAADLEGQDCPAGAGAVPAGAGHK